MAARPYQVLDPRTMGRPVHLLGKFTEQLREDLAELFHTRLNRRYRARFEIGDISLEAATATRPSQKWLTFAANGKRINFALDRNILLCILGYRYGVEAGDAPTAAGSASAETAGAPETATEERLATRLGQQLVDVAVRRINAGSRSASADSSDTEQSVSITELAATPLEHAWTVQVRITERTRQADGSLWFRLEEAWISQLLRELAPARERGKGQKSRGAATQPLPPRLQLTMNARLLEKQMTLGTLLDLRIGDVVPITLGSADVLIGDSHLFTASVAEHKGKLCLTSFEPVE